MRKKTVLCGVFMVLMICTTRAFAAERVEPVFCANANMAEVAAELLSDGDAYVSGVGLSGGDKQQVLSVVQAYVDAVSATSATPTVKGAVVHSGTPDERIKLVVLPVSDEFAEAELEVLSAHAGSTTTSISNYLCQRLSYDKEAAAGKLTLSSPQATARGSIMNGKAVCMGYANAFAVLAERSGIKSVKIRGYNANGYHVINVVEGGFVCDVTYADSSGVSNYIMISLEDYCEKTGFRPMVDFAVAFGLKYKTQ